LLSDTKIAIQQRYLGETKLKVVVLLSRVERDKTLGEIAIPNFLYISSRDCKNAKYLTNTHLLHAFRISKTHLNKIKP
jgi:hypothetical protein